MAHAKFIFKKQEVAFVDVFVVLIEQCSKALVFHFSLKKALVLSVARDVQARRPGRQRVLQRLGRCRGPPVDEADVLLGERLLEEVPLPGVVDPRVVLLILRLRNLELPRAGK